MVKLVTADRLASLLLLNKVYEITPQPFRMQPTLTLAIDIQEYIEFCEGLRDSYVLSTKTNAIIEAIGKFRLKLSSLELLCCFARDIALGQIKELMYAYEYGKGATKLKAQFDGSERKLVLSKYPDDWLEELEETVEEIDSYLYYRMYPYTLSQLAVDTENSDLLKEAVMMYHMANLRVVASFV